VEADIVVENRKFDTANTRSRANHVIPHVVKTMIAHILVNEAGVNLRSVHDPRGSHVSRSVVVDPQFIDLVRKKKLLNKRSRPLEIVPNWDGCNDHLTIPQK